MKRFAIACVLGGILAGTAAPAQAEELFVHRNGYGQVSMSSWSNGYRHIAFIAMYHSSGEMVTVVRCNNGFSDRQVWDDRGPNFRYVVRVPTYVRCTHRFTVRSNSYIRAGIGGY